MAEEQGSSPVYLVDQITFNKTFNAHAWVLTVTETRTLVFARARRQGIQNFCKYQVIYFNMHLQ